MRISGRGLTVGLAALALTAAAGVPPATAAPAAPAAPAATPVEASREAAPSWRLAGSWATPAPVTSLDVAPDGDVVAALRNRSVRTYGPAGRPVSTFRVRYVPGSLDVAPDGRIHLLPGPQAYDVPRVMRVHGPRGRVVRSYAGRPDGFPQVGGFDVDEGGRRLVVADSAGVQVRVHDVATGRTLEEWGEDGTEGGPKAPLFFDFPGDVAAMPGDRVAVADTGNGRIKVFTTGGRFVQQMGGRYGGRLFPQGVSRVAVGGGRFFGLDAENSTVDVFGATGRHQRELDAGLTRALDLAVTPDGTTLYLAGRLPSGEHGVVRFVRR